MADVQGKSSLQRIVEVLESHQVEFLVVGGQAETLFGSPRVTFDIDLCYRRTPANLQRLAAALREIKPRLRNAPTDLPFQLDARSLALGSNFTFDTSEGPLLLGWVEPLGAFDALLERSEAYTLGSVTVRTTSLEDLIRVKEHIRRPKDRESLFQLKAFRQLRSEASQRDQ